MRAIRAGLAVDEARRDPGAWVSCLDDLRNIGDHAPLRGWTLPGDVVFALVGHDVGDLDWYYKAQMEGVVAREIR